MSDFAGDSAFSVMGVRILSGITSGAIGITFAQPLDVVKVRMQASTMASPYKSSFDAYKTIYIKEGFGGLFKGYFANLIRNSIINATELVCYDTFKDLLLKTELMKDGLSCHFTAAFGAGFAATVIASPIDVVKTRLMNSSVKVSILQCAQMLYREKGLAAFYKGYLFIQTIIFF